MRSFGKWVVFGPVLDLPTFHVQLLVSSYQSSVLGGLGVGKEITQLMK